jgi:hypothetical protein
MTLRFTGPPPVGKKPVSSNVKVETDVLEVMFNKKKIDTSLATQNSSGVATPGNQGLAVIFELATTPGGLHATEPLASQTRYTE